MVLNLSNFVNTQGPTVNPEVVQEGPNCLGASLQMSYSSELTSLEDILYLHDRGLCNMFTFKFANFIVVDVPIYLKWNFTSNTISVLNLTSGEELSPISLTQEGESDQLSSDEINSIFGVPETVPFREMLSWMFVVWFSIALYDLGQTSLGANYKSIFVDGAMVNNYTSFFNDVLVPLLPFIYPINFSVNDSSPFQPMPASLLLNYSCTLRQLKDWLSFSISILASDSALIIAAYNLFIFIAGWIQKRRNKAGEELFYLI